MDKLTYQYNESSNKLKKIEEKATGSFAIPNYSLESPRSYTYDVNGNMTYDPSMNKYVTYNDLNLPESVGGLYTGKSFYHYDASGTKLAKSMETADGAIGNVTSYVGNLIFEGNNLAFVLHSEGRLVPDEDGKWNYEYNMKDHLGNTRAVIAGSIMGGKVDLIQESHYYPFGLSFKTKNYTSIGNKFLFNGKELQEETGWYDFGARHQDRIIGRWHVIDPLAEKYINESPYVYVGNRPTMMIDPDGMAYRPTTDSTGAYIGFEWVDDSEAYDKDGNLKDGLFEKAILFQQNGEWGFGTCQNGKYVSYRIESSIATVYDYEVTTDEDGNTFKTPTTSSYDASTKPSDPFAFGQVRTSSLYQAVRW